MSAERLCGNCKHFGPLINEYTREPDPHRYTCFCPCVGPCGHGVDYAPEDTCNCRKDCAHCGEGFELCPTKVLLRLADES